MQALKLIHFSTPQDYAVVYQKMRATTLARNEHSPDEIWLLEHHPVYTQGQAGKAEHILRPGSIPVVQSDRGGQITYHGPGQIMVYCLLDLPRRNMGIRDCVTLLENTVIELLKKYHITGFAKPDAPGIYINDSGITSKIASIGLRVRKGCSYHGLCLNVDGDLSPFLGINPCGYENLAMTQIKDHIPNISIQTIYQDLEIILKNQLESPQELVL